MSDTDPPDPAAPDAASLARDWMTLFATELAGLAADREALETWQGLLAMWVRAAAGGAHDPARPAPAAAASVAELAAFAARLDAIERRLAALERPVAGGGRRRKPAG